MARAPVSSQALYTGIPPEASPYRDQRGFGVGSCCAQDRSDRSDGGWSYVGEGRGKYQQVESFNYVGEGGGDYDREFVHVRRNPWFRNCCLGTLCCSMLSMALVSLLYLGLQYNAPAPSGNDFQVVEGTNEPAVNDRYDCVMGFESWRLSWSTSQKEWCCEHHNRGCRRFDCHTGYSRRTLEWSVERMAWCCQHEAVGCTHGCNTVCDVKGEAASCQERIGWASKNLYKDLPDGCGRAHNLVLQECQICATCLLDASGCNQTRAYDCFAGLKNYKAGWSASKKQWCCARMGVACPFDCDSGFSNWREGWSEAKRQWCCKYAKRGCTTTTTALPEPYDCEAGFFNWKQGWSNAKKMWCCQEYSRGCSTTQNTPVVVVVATSTLTNTTVTSTAMNTTVMGPTVMGTTANGTAANGTTATPTNATSSSSSSSNTTTNATTSTATVTTLLNTSTTSTGTTTSNTTSTTGTTNTTTSTAPLPS